MYKELLSFDAANKEDISCLVNGIISFLALLFESLILNSTGFLVIKFSYIACLKIACKVVFFVFIDLTYN